MLEVAQDSQQADQGDVLQGWLDWQPVTRAAEPGACQEPFGEDIDFLNQKCLCLKNWLELAGVSDLPSFQE